MTKQTWQTLWSRIHRSGWRNSGSSRRVARQRAGDVQVLEDRAMLSAGDLDATFGTGGSVFADVTPLADLGSDIAIQSDGKILALATSELSPTAGMSLTRYHSDGTVDGSFGTGGTTSILGADVEAAALALQSDGKIVVVGKTNPLSIGIHPVVWRFNTDGTLDAGFGAGGEAVFSFGAGGSLTDLAIQSDGSIVVVGGTGDIGAFDFASLPLGSTAIARLDSSGNLDGGFGTGGIVTLSPLGGNSVAQGVALQTDGKIVVCGESSADFITDSNNGQSTLWRLNSDGSLDLSFSGDGVITTDVGVGNREYASDVAIAADGKIVIGGGFFPNALNLPNTYVARFDSNGAPDAGFGGGGITITDWSENLALQTALELQADGKIVVSATTLNLASAPPLNVFMLGRYTDAGVLDASFGSGGIVKVGFADDNIAMDLAFQADHKIVVVGATTPDNFGTAQLIVARFDNDVVIANNDPVIDSLTNSSPSVGVTQFGETVTVGGTFSDADTGDTHVVSIDWGDGSSSIAPDTEASGSGSFSDDHAYSTGGVFTVTVTVTDNRTGETSQSTTVVVSGIGLAPDGTLYVIGSSSADDVVLDMRVQDSLLRAELNSTGGDGSSVLTVNVNLVTAIVVQLGDTSDRLRVENDLPINMLVDGGGGNDDLETGEGNDVIFAGAGHDRVDGGSGDDLILGGDGNDRLRGGRGRDLLIGGIGADRLDADQDGDVLIAGFTSYDGNLSALQALRAEWTSADSVATRVSNLRNGTGLAAGFALNGDDGGTQTVFSDVETDSLRGDSGLDVFWANVISDNGGPLDRVWSDRSETIFDIDF